MENPSDDELAKYIMQRLNNEFSGQEAEIEAVPGGFEISTDIGSSFTYEIFGVTREDVARKYFDHCLQAMEREVKRLGSLFSLVFRNKERQASEAKLERLRRWEETHLIF